uniref:Uncharacterized protein n=1 Tax=Glossina brevipalpis TaxID=37001 RepID=A0A1A9W669_9MUSC
MAKTDKWAIKVFNDLPKMLNQKFKIVLVIGLKIELKKQLIEKPTVLFNIKIVVVVELFTATYIFLLIFLTLNSKKNTSNVAKSKKTETLVGETGIRPELTLRQNHDEIKCPKNVSIPVVSGVNWLSLYFKYLMKRLVKEESVKEIIDQSHVTYDASVNTRSRIHIYIRMKSLT